MFATTLKTAAIATVVILATATGSMAASWGWVAQDANVRKNHMNVAPVVNYVEAGQKVKIVGQWNNWYKLQLPGPDGWVRKNVVKSHPVKFPGYGYGYGYDHGYGYGGGSFCINGQKASFCLSGGY